MTVNQIIKKALERLQNEGRLLTPDFYSIAFCNEAKRAGILIEDCNHVERFIPMLDNKLQDEARQYHVRTTQEMVRFLISRLNRMNPTQCSQLLNAQTVLTKRILQAVDLLHNKEASALAQKTLTLMDEQTSPEKLDHLRQSWANFMTFYDDTFLQKLSMYGRVDTADLQGTIEHLDLGNAKGEATSMDFRDLSLLMIASLVPSIAPSVNDELAGVSEELRRNPGLLTSKTMIDEIKAAIKLRISLDKDSLKEMVVSLDTVLDKLSMQLIELIERSDSSTDEIHAIKMDLESLEAENHYDFKTAHRKLYTIAVMLEEKTARLSESLQEPSAVIHTLATRVNDLEKDLAIAQQASHEDFLTKLYNKRALDEQIKIKEAEYERYDRNYSVIMYDLDHFKKINDTYGHDAGDAVLKAFANILKKQSRNVDIVGRFGGEEFLGLLSDTDLEGAVVLANKVVDSVRKSRFVYKGQRIKVTLSAGVAERKAFPSRQATINSADERLYDAKRNGRNKVEPKLGSGAKAHSSKKLT